MTLKIVTVTAGLSEPSSTALLGEQLTAAMVSSLDDAGVSAETLEVRLRDIAKDITNHYLTGFPMGKLAQALDAVRDADAVITVTPTFKASNSGLFKSFWDLVEDDSMLGTTVLLGATGGTARHSLMIDTAMRPLFGYLKAQVIPTGVFVATDDFGSDASLDRRIAAAGREMAQFLLLKAGALQNAKNSSVNSTDKNESVNFGDKELKNVEKEPFDMEGEFDDKNGANSGDFFGIATTQKNSSKYKAPGLEPLTVTPFEQLLKG
ncbi:CE1759 family FMN reductase [Rothia aerolata]|uniref:NADPH-dependent FMN reductase-like domain-containing protein n=1 Tax=Rothia aerolata TaxID=1812262 RepID=A0A917MVA7_9MICC|nr:CE1759 family FMN reductase [Rothia aerolata]GGH66393.1 hypothetical protein GCM10007359_20520 [Rothia aerolata]